MYIRIHTSTFISLQLCQLGMDTKVPEWGGISRSPTPPVAHLHSTQLLSLQLPTPFFSPPPLSAVLGGCSYQHELPTEGSSGTSSASQHFRLHISSGGWDRIRQSAKIRHTAQHSNASTSSPSQSHRSPISGRHQ